MPYLNIANPELKPRSK